MMGVDKRKRPIVSWHKVRATEGIVLVPQRWVRVGQPSLECRTVRRVGYEHNRDYLQSSALPEGPEYCRHEVGIRRSVLVLENRLIESLVYLVVGVIFLVLGLLSANVNFQVLFFILTAFFIFAIFRPPSLS
jgi:hypothetical protein